MHKFLFSVILLGLVVGLVAAQGGRRIDGKVMDAESREGLAGANLVLLDTNKGASTDVDGKFSISNLEPGLYRLEVSYVGYISEIITDIQVLSRKPVKLEIALKPQNLTTDAIVVSAGYFSEEKLTPTSVIGLQREEIRRFPGGFEDVVRTVSVLPGVSVNPAGGRNDLLVRGGGPSENLFVINNVEVPSINHFTTQGASSGSLSFINLDFVDNVSFSSGGFQARYGEKMSSILSLDLAEGRQDRLGGKGLISATQFGLNLEGPLGTKGNFLMSARKSYLDLIFKAAGLPFIPVYTDYNLLANYEPMPGHKISAFAFLALDNIDRNLSNAKNRAFNARLLDNTQNQFVSGLNWRRVHQNGYSDLTLSASLYQFRFSQADSQSVEYFRSKADEVEYALRGQRFMKISKPLNLLFGVQIKIKQNKNNTVFAGTIYNRSGQRIALDQLGLNPRTDSNRYMQTYALFAETDWDITSRMNLNSGLRFNYYPALTNAFYLAPRLGLKYQLNAKHSIKLNYGHYYQPPSNVWLVNPKNKKLKALQNRMAIAAWDYLVRPDVRFTAEVYYKKYLDLPVGITPGYNDYLVISNTGSGYGGREDDFQSFGFFDMLPDGKGEAYGVELLLQKKFSDVPLYGKASVSVGKSSLTAFNGKTYPAAFDQRFIFNLSAGYRITPTLEVSGKFRYFSGLPYTPVYRPSENPVNPGQIQNLPQEYLSARLKAGHHLDLRLDKYFVFRKWTLITYVDIQNVYNYKIPVKPRYDFWEDKIDTANGIGILPSIGISAEF